MGYLVELEKQVEQINKHHKKKMEECERFSSVCQYLMPHPKGIFRNKCPYCRSKLKLIKHSCNPCFMTAYQYWEWLCPQEDYRYMEERYYGDN